MIACLFSFGKCNKKKKCCIKKATAETSSAKLNANEVWMQFNETNCANPWHFNWFTTPTQEQISGAVKSDLLGKGIVILEFRTYLASVVPICEGCDCTNGTTYYVRVNSSQIEKLKELKFEITSYVPETAIINESK